MTEEEESKRRQAEFELRTKLFMEALDVDEFFAQLLVAEGFTNLEEVAYVEIDELLVIDGVDEDTAGELQTRAREFLEAKAAAALAKARELGAEDSLITFEGITLKWQKCWRKTVSKRWKISRLVQIGNWPVAGPLWMASASKMTAC